MTTVNNTLLTIQMITNEALRVLENNLTFAKGVNREYEDQFGRVGAKIGSVVNIRKPVRYVGRTGQALSLEASVETSVPLVLTTQFGVDFEFSSPDLALSIDKFSERFIKPAIATIANKIDLDGLKLANSIGNTAYSVDSTGAIAVAGNLRTYLNAGAKMDGDATPMDGQRSVCIDAYTQAALVDNLKGLFNSTTEIEEQYKTGNMGLAAGFKFNMDQNVISHTFGSAVGVDTIKVYGANQSGTTLNVQGFVNTLNAGDTFTIPGVYAVNPQSRQSTGKLREFVVLNTITGAGATTTTSLVISPALIGPNSDGSNSQFQNVTALPANNATLSFIGTAGNTVKYGLAYHKDAFTLACADLPLPIGNAVEAARVSDDELGLSIRIVRQYDINSDQWPCRLDILYGWAVLYPELACKVISDPSNANAPV